MQRSRRSGIHSNVSGCPPLVTYFGSEAKPNCANGFKALAKRWLPSRSGNNCRGVSDISDPSLHGTRCGPESRGPPKECAVSIHHAFGQQLLVGGAGVIVGFLEVGLFIGFDEVAFLGGAFVQAFNVPFGAPTRGANRFAINENEDWIGM